MNEIFKAVSAVDSIFIAYDDLCPPFVVQFVIEGSGRPTLDALRAALDATTKMNPGSALQLAKRDGADVWCAGLGPKLTLLAAPSFRGTSEEAAPFLLAPLDPRNGPSCELMFVEGAEKTYLIFRALHAVMDGQGTLLWAKDFLRALRGGPLVGQKSRLTSDELVRALNMDTRPLPPVNALYPFRAKSRAESSPKPDPELHFRWRRLTFDRIFEPKMLTKIAVRLAERARRNGPGIVRFNIPADLRHHCPAEHSTGNLLGTLFFEVGEETTWEMLSFRIVQQIYRQKEAEPLSVHTLVRNVGLGVFRFLVSDFFAGQNQRGLYFFTATLSQLGALKGQELSAPSFSAESCFFVPPFFDWVCYLAINGFDQKVEATVALPIELCGEGQLNELADLVFYAITAEDAPHST